MTIPILAASTLGLAAILASTQNMNWPEFFNAFAGAVAVILAALAAAWNKIQSGKLEQIKLEMEQARKHAEEAARVVNDSRAERAEQLTRMEVKADAAYSHANNTNDKMAVLNETIARQQDEILQLRQQQGGGQLEIKHTKPADTAGKAP